MERFDRHEAIGRSPVISWGVLNSTFVGAGGGPWAEGVQPLTKTGWVSADDLNRIGLVGHLGQLIGNSDMHDGNLSFQPVQVAGQAQLQLAPIYDMLPMTYAPVRGVELPPRTYAPRLPLPSEKDLWRRAAMAAVAFWDRAVADDRSAPNFARCAFKTR